jgi:CMP/dCMP kinase
MQPKVIAMDGPAGSGKSTAARRLADAIGFTHLNTGAMYRAVAYEALETGIDLGDGLVSSEIAGVARAMRFEYSIVDGRQRFSVNGVDRTEALFTAALTGLLKPVVNNLDVRAALTEKMRESVKEFLARGAKGVVMEGRDIGTVVFPDAVLKFYIHADLEARAQRRVKELHERNENVSLEGIKKQIQFRDDTDRGREVGALIQAPDAIDIDTTHLNEEATLSRLLEVVRQRGLA